MKKQYVVWLRSSSVFAITSILFLFACGGDGGESDPKPEPEPVVTTITINPASVKQEMIGFGGALTWYSDWVTANDKKEEIADLIFSDLGIDIIRLKN